MIEMIKKCLKHKPHYAKLFSRFDASKQELVDVMRDQHNHLLSDLILNQQKPEYANGFTFCHSVFNNLEIVKDKR